MSLTIVRTDLVRPLEQIVGADIDEDAAYELVTAGKATWGPETEIPPALYLLIDFELHGFTYPAGAMLHVGCEVNEAEALVLMRGVIGTPGGGVVSVPQGGVG